MTEDKRLSGLERTAYGFLIVALLLLLAQCAAEALDDPLVVMFAVFFGAVTLAIILDILHEDYLMGKREEALAYLLGKTEKIYFYGFPVSECLQANVTWELYWHQMGDFARQIGLLTLCALRGDGDPYDEAELYARHQEESGAINDHYVAIARFFHGGRWWEFNLSGELTEYGLQTSKRFKHEGYERITFWSLDGNKRRILEGCENPEKSSLMPDAKFAETETFSEYEKLVQYGANCAINFWRWREEERS